MFATLTREHRRSSGGDLHHKLSTPRGSSFTFTMPSRKHTNINTLKLNSSIYSTLSCSPSPSLRNFDPHRLNATQLNMGMPFGTIRFQTSIKQDPG